MEDFNTLLSAIDRTRIHTCSKDVDNLNDTIVNIDLNDA